MKHILLILSLVIVVGISTGMLSIVYYKTEHRVSLNSNIKLQQSILDVFGINYDKNNIGEVFKNNIIIRKKDDMTLYESEKGTAIEITGPGFWGTIDAIIALEPDFQTIIGFKVLKHSETPGLGGRITEDTFQDQFRGKRVLPEIRIVKRIKDQKENTESITRATPMSKANNQVDAITGATQSSKAIERIINDNIKIFYKKMGI